MAIPSHRAALTATVRHRIPQQCMHGNFYAAEITACSWSINRCRFIGSLAT
jgi:hypothetical protein